MDPEVHALTGAYVCDALDGAERAAFEEHLAQCEACTLEVAELRETAAVLGAAAHQAPPERLYTTVVARIEVTRQLAPAPAADAAAAAAEEPAAGASAAGAPSGTGDAATGDATGNVIPIERGRGRHSESRARRVSRAAVAGWAAAAVLAGVVAGLSVQNIDQDRQISRSEARATQLSALLSAPDVATGVAQVRGGGTVTVVDSRHLDQAAITLTGLANPPAGKSYQLWMIGPSGTRSGGVVPAGAYDTTTPILAAGLGDTASLGITVEPTQGSAQPTTTPVLLMTMPTHT